MASDLFKPVLNDRTRSPNFFNGRLLTGEAMSEEQDAQRAVNELLGQALGDGVAYGLEVEVASLSTVTKPVLNVKSGVAVNRLGELLLLASDTQVQLVRPAEDVPSPTTIFRACKPVTNGTYVADAGVYLLTICSVRAGNGLAPVYGLGAAPSGCNIKDVIDAVEFRLLELPTKDIPSDAYLRNTVAYRCFGVDHLADFAKDPLGTKTPPSTLLDAIRGTDLTDCDVPLAILYWTATGGVQFVDLWAVRRRLTKTSTATTFEALTDVRRAASEAMVLQFQAHLATIAAENTSTSFNASSRFKRFPPFGMLPVGSTAGRDFSSLAFFSGLKTRGPFYIEGSRLTSIFDEALPFFPIDLASRELIWLYRIRENQQTIDRLIGAIPRAALLFTTGHGPWRGDAHYDVSKWHYANYA